MSKPVRIPLSGGNYYALVDAEDAPRVAAFAWSASWESYKRRKIYAVRRVLVNGVRVGVKLHRFVLDLPPFLQDPKRRVVHHVVAHETLDCRKSNLRVVSQFTNMRFTAKYPDGDLPAPPGPRDNYELCNDCARATDAKGIYVCAPCRAEVWS